MTVEYVCPNGHPFPDRIVAPCGHPDCEAGVTCVPLAEALELRRERDVLRAELATIRGVFASTSGEHPVGGRRPDGYPAEAWRGNESIRDEL